MIMAYDWVTVYCPVCKKRLGEKHKQTLSSFICGEEGCSKTKHFFLGDAKRPHKSTPWHAYYDKKNQCGKPCCADREKG